jgi:hypothetical protein
VFVVILNQLATDMDVQHFAARLFFQFDCHIMLSSFLDITIPFRPVQ